MRYGALGDTNVFLKCEIPKWRAIMSDAIVTVICVMVSLLVLVQLSHNAKLSNGHSHASNLRLPRVSYSLRVQHALC